MRKQTPPQPETKFAESLSYNLAHSGHVNTRSEKFENAAITRLDYQPLLNGACAPREQRNNHRLQKSLSAPSRVRVNHIIMKSSSFSESSVFKMFSIHTKTQGQCFHIPPGLKSVLVKPVSFIFTRNRQASIKLNIHTKKRKTTKY